MFGEKIADFLLLANLAEYPCKVNLVSFQHIYPKATFCEKVDRGDD